MHEQRTSLLRVYFRILAICFLSESRFLTAFFQADNRLVFSLSISLHRAIYRSSVALEALADGLFGYLSFFGFFIGEKFEIVIHEARTKEACAI